MSLWNPYAFSVTGQPVAPAAPPALRVLDGQASAQQLAMAQHAFAQFSARARLSAAPNPTETGRLQDGTPYKIIDVAGTRTMMLWAGSTIKRDFIAWTSFVGAEYLPVWDRPVIDLPVLPPLPPYPTRPPDPVYVFSAFTAWITPVTDTVISSDNPYVTERHVSVVQTVAEGQYSVQNFTGTRTREYLYNPGAEYPYAMRATYVDWLSVVAQLDEDGVYIYGSEDVWLANGIDETDTGDGISISNTGAAAGARASASAAASAAEAENTVIRAQWSAEIDAWDAETRVWSDLRNAREEEVGKPHLPLIETRKQARAAQVAAAWEYLLGGVGDRHLTARLLSFPYSVSYKSTPPAFSGGSVTVLGPPVEAAGDAERTTTLVGAGPFTNLPDEPGNSRPLRADMIPPECLFGWKASGSFTHAIRFAENHRGDELALKPPGLGDVSFTYDPAYFASATLTQDSASGLLVDSDAFVPPGAKFTTVVFEYLVLDPFTGEQIWTPCPELVWHDSIWLRSLGDKTDTPRYYGEGDVPTTLKVRVGGVISQTRTEWVTWSEARRTSSPPGGGQEYPFIASMGKGPVLPNTPTAVVIAEKLHSAANPAPLQTISFYRNASFLWSGNPTGLAAAKSAAWVSDAAAAPQSQFILLSLKSTGVIKP